MTLEDNQKGLLKESKMMRIDMDLKLDSCEFHKQLSAKVDRSEFEAMFPAGEDGNDYFK